MITSTIYLITAYAFVIVTLAVLAGFYIWRNITLSRRIRNLTILPHQKIEQFSQNWMSVLRKKLRKNKEMEHGRDPKIAPYAPVKNSLNLWRLLPFLSFFLMGALIFFYLMTLDRQSNPSSSDVMVGQAAPTLSMPLMNIKNNRTEFSISELAGRAALINFWASWCAPCRVEHPFLMQLAQDSRFDVIGINYKDAETNALSFLAQFGNPFSLVAADRYGRAAIEWGALGIPETYLIDKKGIILYRHIGPLDFDTITTKLLPAIHAAL